jgi:hypothetical protein
MATPNTINALQILSDVIRDPASRRHFHENPDGTLVNAGADPHDVPPEVWRTLTHMTLGELAAIADLGVALADAGLLDGSVAWRHVV